jgi:hypothetical protein
MELVFLVNNQVMTRPPVPGWTVAAFRTILVIGRCALVGCIGGLLLTCLAGCSADITRDVAVDRFDVVLTVLADGSLDVIETITVRAERPGARFARDVPAVNVDRIVDIAATVDGRSPGPSGGEVQVDRSGALHASWPITAAGRSLHTIVLHYRLAGALAAQGTRGILRWSPLPVGRTYAVGASRVDLVVPPGSSFAVGPALQFSRAPLARRPDGATAELTLVAPGDPAVITAEIVLGSLDMAEPDWQSNALRGHQLMPAFISAGVCLVAIGAGVIVMVRLQYPRPMIGEADLAHATPEVLPPAMAAAVTSVRSRFAMDPAARLATILDLAGRGRLELSSEGILSLGPHGVNAADGAEPARAHERAIADQLWLGRNGTDPMPLPKAAALLERGRRRISRAFMEDLVTSGLVDAERLSVARGLRATGGVALVLAAAGAVVCEAALSRFGVWPMSVPLGLSVMSVLFVWAAARVPLLSQAGERASAAWRARVHERRTAAGAGLGSGPEFERWLAVAVACGFAQEWIAAWARHLQGPPPASLVLVRQYTSRL